MRLIYKKRYRRRPMAKRDSTELSWMGICIIISLLTAFIVRSITGPPYRVMTYCNLRQILPPVWLMVVLWIGWYILLGGVLGSVLGYRYCTDEVSKYKGGMLFVLMMSLGYVWYPMFFGAAALFFALLVCEAVLVLSVLCTIIFMRVRKSAACVMLGFSAWMAYMVALNIMCLFAN